MTIRVISAYLTGKHSDKGVLAGALSMAKRFHGHIDAVFAHPDPRMVALATEEGVSSELYQSFIKQLEQEWSVTAAKAKKSFDAWREEHQIRQTRTPAGDMPTADWREASGAPEDTLGRNSRIADLTVAALPSRDMESPNNMEYEAILFGARRPVLLMPPDGKLDPMVGPAMVAWNGSPEATHAVASALPVLQVLDDVSIFSADEGKVSAGMAQDLAGYLAWHGIDAHVLEASSKKAGNVAESLLATAAGAKAHLIVMGAYSHSRLRESLFGGVTKHILAHSKIPIFMAH